MSISLDPTAAPLRAAVLRGPTRNPLGPVLVASSGDRTPSRALRGADLIARRIGADLHLLRVVPPSDPHLVNPAWDLARATREAQRVLAASRHTRKVSDRILQQRLPAGRICVRLGHFVDQVAQRTAELDAMIIVVPPSIRHLASAVNVLAQRTDCPVLVPRGCESLLTLLAATDLEDSGEPVLAKAVELARLLDAAVVALHSVAHVDAGGDEPGARCDPLARLERAAHRFDHRLTPIVRRGVDPVRNILELARAHDAGIIVVGTRARADRTPLNTAARLVSRARRSVLVAPLGVRFQSKPANAV